MKEFKDWISGKSEYHIRALGPTALKFAEGYLKEMGEIELYKNKPQIKES